MASHDSEAHVHVTLACGSTPCDAEVGRAFLQERIALFARIVFIICFGFYVLANIIHLIGAPEEPFHFIQCGHNQFHLLASAILCLMWALAAGRPRSAKHLRLVDLGGTFLTCLAFALVTWTGCEGDWEYQALLGTTNTLVARAVMVPSAPRQTFWLGLASSLPTLIATYAIVSLPVHVASAALPPWVTTSIFGLWCAVAVVTSTVGSRVIFGLHRDVRAAQRLGQYTLEEKIGEGGMGEVHKARHAILRRPTAIKLLRREKVGDRCIARFEREVQLTSRLTHPNTIAIYDYGHTPDGVFYYAMEYLPGINLDELLRLEGPPPPGRVIHILKQVCASLGEAHSLGLIHRDIKAANVILCERGGVYDVAKVVDFGLVKEMDPMHDVSLSVAGLIAGTPLYLPPEAIRTPEKVDARGDIYSVGVLGYYLLSGKHVFEGRNFVEVCGHHLHTPPTPLSLRVEVPVPADLEAVIMACLEKDPDRRPRDARELHRRLDACRDSGRWSEELAAAWWRNNEVRIKTARSKAEPTATVWTPGSPGGSSRASEPTALVEHAPLVGQAPIGEQRPLPEQGPLVEAK